MGIVRLVLHNLYGGSISLPYPERPAIQSDYRGMVQNSSEQCTGCAVCAYVCTTSAIAVTRTADGFEWRYDAGQCTFCARCVQRCPKQSITMQGTRPPVYSQHGGLRQHFTVMKKKKPVPVVPAAVDAVGPAAAAVQE